MRQITQTCCKQVWMLLIRRGIVVLPKLSCGDITSAANSCLQRVFLRLVAFSIAFFFHLVRLCSHTRTFRSRARVVGQCTAMTIGTIAAGRTIGVLVVGTMQAAVAMIEQAMAMLLRQPLEFHQHSQMLLQ